MQNFVFDENTKAVLQMSQLLDFGIDPDKGYFLSSGDTNWGAFKKLFAHGKVLPSGSCYSVGLGGHICGGGDGILSRKYGITVDWLTGVEVVVKDGKDKDGKDSKDPQPARLLYVSKDSCDPEEYDLFWAHTGGGGGNFGVITKYYFKEMPKAPMVRQPPHTLYCLASAYHPSRHTTASPPSPTLTPPLSLPALPDPPPPSPPSLPSRRAS